MKKSARNAVKASLTIALLLVATTLYAAESPPAVPAPVALMPATSFASKPVLEGQSIVHDFVIQNHGNAVLKVLEVRTG